MVKKQRKRMRLSLLLCVCLLLLLLAQQIGSCVAYLTSLSATCVGVFTGAGRPDWSAPSGGSETSSLPAVGDGSQAVPYLAALLSFGAVIGLLGMDRNRRGRITKQDRREG